MEPIEVAADQVSFVASGRSILDAVSLDVRPGAVTVLLGPSGAGKSTLLKVIAGLLAPSRGRVRFGADDVTAVPTERRPIGVAFQEPRLFPFLTVLENVAFPLEARGVARPERERAAREALELARVGDLAGRGTRNLSGGEAQRVALARAICHRPPVLLLDEPLAALDAQLRRALRSDLAALVRHLGATTLVVTHDQEDAFALAGELALLRQGRVVEQGRAEELYRRPRSAFTATFLGEGVLLPGKRSAGELDLGFVRVPAPATATHVLLRPQDLRLAREGEAGAFTLPVRDRSFVAGRRRITVVHGEASIPVDLDPDATVGAAVALALAGPVHALEGPSV
jgi:putative spermidine/putrescine transport system ATP-binding protein